jgi:hypothetical protein
VRFSHSLPCEGRKLQINHLICAAYATRRVNGVEDSRSTPKGRWARRVPPRRSTLSLTTR